MKLRIFNPVSGKTEPFKPISPKKAKMYVCGITPYDTTHLGHAFTYASFDVLMRYLNFNGIDVEYTQNVTDIDDDVLKRAKKEGRDWKELGEFWTKRFIADLKSLNVIMPDHYVKATDSMPQIIKMIKTLMDKGFAYQAGGNVYFDVKKFPKYGQLSHFNTGQMKLMLKERGGDPDDLSKRNPLDFIVWQARAEGEPYWDTPWGKGRPGWHIECSAMIYQYLGAQIDIHGGGRDLIFPHHESEIAQSESFTGKHPFTRYFMHTAMVMYVGEKMSKSLGNLVLVSDLVKTHSPNAIRWVLLSHQYRQVWEYNQAEIEDADLQIKRIAKVLSGKRSGKNAINKDIVEEFANAMDDDLNTPKALGIVKRLSASGDDSATVRHIMDVLGFSKIG